MKSTTVQELHGRTDGIVVDVREPDEFATGHAPRAVNIPLQQLGDRVNELPSDGPVYLICQAGGRSSRATQALGELGLDAVNVEGGTSAWIQAGLPVSNTP